MLLNPDENPASSYLVRLFGGRDIFLGAAALAVPKRDRNKILGYAAPIDLTDATAAAVAGLRRQIPARVAALAAVSGFIGACLGAAAAGCGRQNGNRREAIAVDGTFVVAPAVTAG
jgi:hypothetical protein